MKRKTSIEAYNKIKRYGLLSHRRWQVYDLLFHHGPLTGREVNKALSTQRGNNSSTFIGRLSELRDRGVVYECGEKLDEETKQTVLLWDVTENLPVKIDAPKKTKCNQCGGKGYITEAQTRMF